MFSTKLIAFVAALMAQEAVALNAHRHAHGDFHAKREVAYVNDVVTVTDWTTVTVWDDGAPASTPTPKKVFKDTHTHATTSSTSASVGFTSSANSTTSTATSSSFSSSSTSSSTTPLSTSSSTSSTIWSSSSSTSPVPSPTAVQVYSGVPTWPLTPIFAQTTLATSTKPASTYVAAPSSSSAAAVNVDVAFVGQQLTSTSATTAAAAVATTTTSSSSSGSGKRGLAYNDGSLLSPFLGSGSKCSWSYNWGQIADASAPSHVEFVPMLWSPAHASTWTESANTAISNGATSLLSFNECDNSGQCNLDAASAASAHISYMNPFSGKAKIGTPAITNSGNAGEGISWLKSFVSACGGACDFDFCPLHWYNAPDAQEFLEHVANVHEACGKPVWITEFAPISGTDEEISTFLATVMDALDNDSTYSYVERYSYFMAATGSLLSSSTSLSTYGQTFAFH